MAGHSNGNDKLKEFLNNFDGAKGISAIMCIVFFHTIDLGLKIFTTLVVQTTKNDLLLLPCPPSFSRSLDFYSHNIPRM